MPLYRRKRPQDPYSAAKIEQRWSDIAFHCEFLPTDTVLDIGAAEGLVALEIAPKVARVHGIELKAEWVRRAKEEAARRGIANATFEQGSALNYQPSTYDVTLLLGVVGKRDDGGRAVGLNVLARLLAATKRQIILRYGVGRPRRFSWEEIDTVLRGHGFVGTCLDPLPDRGNLIIGIREGA